MEPIRSIFIPKQPPPATMGLRPHLLVFSRCRRKLRRIWDVVPLSPWIRTGASEGVGGSGDPDEPSVESSEVGGARMREVRWGPNRDFRTCREKDIEVLKMIRGRGSRR